MKYTCASHCLKDNIDTIKRKLFKKNKTKNKTKNKNKQTTGEWGTTDSENSDSC